MNIDSAMCAILRDRGLAEMNKALAPLGMVASFPNSMSFGPGGITAKLHVLPLAIGQKPDEALAEKTKKDYEFGAHFLGLPKGSFGKNIVHGGKIYKIAGLVGGRSRRVLIARQPDGKVFAMKPQSVIIGLDAAKSLTA